MYSVEGARVYQMYTSKVGLLGAPLCFGVVRLSLIYTSLVSHAKKVKISLDSFLSVCHGVILVNIFYKTLTYVLKLLIVR